MLDSDWLVANFLKTPWLDWINLISARLNSKSILQHSKSIIVNLNSKSFESNWLRNLLFLFIFIHFSRLFNLSFLTIWDIQNLPLFLFLLIELPSLKRKEKNACLDVEENTLAYTLQDIESTVTF